MAEGKTAILTEELIKEGEGKGYIKLAITYSTGGEHVRWTQNPNKLHDIETEMVNWAEKRGFNVTVRDTFKRGL